MIRVRRSDTLAARKADHVRQAQEHRDHHLLPATGDGERVATGGEGGGAHRERATARGHPPVHGGAEWRRRERLERLRSRQNEQDETGRRD